jgi:hypothetical protein
MAGVEPTFGGSSRAPHRRFRLTAATTGPCSLTYVYASQAAFAIEIGLLRFHRIYRWVEPFQIFLIAAVQTEN